MSHLAIPYNIVKVTDATADRAFDTEYVNLTGRTMTVNITAIVTSTIAGGESKIVGRVEAYPGAGQTTIGSFGLYNCIALPLQLVGGLTMLIPPGCCYDVLMRDNGGIVQLSKWIEAY